ncbi:uncharacterized protein LOC135837933 [Planococcus citri]|uniref:uncharacterized protein LOC135837933 n=1 Tax=Planococcus citri TaxID=170843 RepID=UPI0031F7746B
MPSTPAKLSSWAARSLCIRLVYEWANSDMPVNDIIWRNDKNGHGTCVNHDLFIDHMYEMRVPSTIIVPHLIRDQIDQNITSILDHVKDWIRYHHSKNFFHDEPSSPVNEYLLGLVWNDESRRIDYTASARSMLTNEKLTSMEKFRFACTYCFVEEITKLRDLAEIEITSDWKFRDEPFVVYWSKYLKGELGTIYLPGIFSIEVLMLEKALNDYGLWSSIEYFFSKVDALNRFRLLNEFVNQKGAEHLEELLNKLDDDDEWISACRNSIDKILKDCAESGRFEQIPHVWNRFRGGIDSKTLARIVEQLVPLSMKNKLYFNALTPILIEIWSTAGADLRQSAIEDELLARVGKKCAHMIDHDNEFDLCARREYNDPLELIRTLLSCGDRRRREVFLRDNLHWLVIWAPSTSAVRELLEEFLFWSRDVVNIVREVKDSPQLRFSCSKLIRIGEFDHFDKIVLFFLSHLDELDDVTENTISQYKLSFVDNGDGFRALRANFYSSDWRTVSRFVYTTFRSSNVELYELRSILVDDRMQMDSSTRTYHLREKFSRGEMNDVVEIGKAYFAGSARYAWFKTRCMVELFWCIFGDSNGMNFNRANVQNFFTWCSAESYKVWLEERLSAQPGLLARAFLAQLKGCVDEFTFEASDSMEQFLHWWFAAESEKRQFKRDMIHRYTEFEQIADLLKQRKYRQGVLNWFFDNDAEFVQCFVIFCSAAKVRVPTVGRGQNENINRDERNSRDEDEDDYSFCIMYFLVLCAVISLRIWYHFYRGNN